jgi:two-component system sensor histidine kinase VicK
MDKSNLEQLRELQDRLETTEQELTKRDALLAAIVQNAQDSIIARDLNGRIIAWNRASEELYGWTSEEMIGEPIYKIIPQERIEEHEAWIKSIKDGKAIGPLFTERITKDKRRVTVWITVSPIIARNGEVLGASAIEHEAHDNNGR